MWVLEDQITIYQRDRKLQNKPARPAPVACSARWTQDPAAARGRALSSAKPQPDKTCGSWKTRSRSTKETVSYRTNRRDRRRLLAARAGRRTQRLREAELLARRSPSPTRHVGLGRPDHDLPKRP